MLQDQIIARILVRGIVPEVRQLRRIGVEVERFAKRVVVIDDERAIPIAGRRSATDAAPAFARIATASRPGTA
jgi:hypothetical protein